jgi:glycosyltransferase involved in cell wall biosynthesis
MRILMDLQACQTEGSVRRGVGRYSLSLFQALYAQAAPREVFALAGRHFTDIFDLADGLPADRVISCPPIPPWPSKALWEGGDADMLDAAAYCAFIAPWRFDVVHVAHAFEGFAARRFAYPAHGRKGPGQVFAATLHDLIPLLFPSYYFRNVEFRKWYLSRLAWLKKADVLLAISESTRRDAIDRLGLAPDRVVNISGGLPSAFKVLRPNQEELAGARHRAGLTRPFVMYTGGDDYRKNIAGAIFGFAALPDETRAAHQLAVVCDISPERCKKYKKQCQYLGLREDEVVFTGYVSDEDLSALLQNCAAFIFPSLYEGFGLPLLEAMASGAPVIGGDNSSLKEIIGRADAMFDAGSSTSIAGALNRVLTDKNFADDLRRFGLARAGEFTYEKSAAIALEAFDEALARARQAGVKAAAGGWLPRKRLAYLTPLPPTPSGIASYSADFLPYLAEHFDIDVYIDGDASSDEAINAAFRIFNFKTFEAAASAYDAILYEFGASESHMHMFELLEKFPGVATLHDAFLSGVISYMQHVGYRDNYFWREMLYSHGPRFRGRLLNEKAVDPNRAAIIDLPGTKRVFDLAVGVISHSPFNLEVVRENYPEGLRASYRLAPQAVSLPPQVAAIDRARMLDKFKCPGEAFVIAAFGHIVWTKCGDLLLEAFKSSRLASEPEVHLFYVGSLGADQAALSLGQEIARDDLGGRIHITGFLEDDEYQSMLKAADVAVQLRKNLRCGQPRGILDVLANGTALVFNNDGGYLDYPEDVALKLSAAPDRAELVEALEKLYFNPRQREAFGQAGREYVRERHDPHKCAALYAAAIHEMYAKKEAASLSRQAASFAPHLAACENADAAAESTAQWLTALPKPDFSRRRIFFDVSYNAAFNHGTGIARVTRSIVKNAYASNRAGFEPVAAHLAEGQLRVPVAWLEELGCILPYEAQGGLSAQPPDFSPGDVLLMLDSSWERFAEFIPIFEKARQARTEIISYAYDILPLTMPHFFDENIPRVLGDWLRLAATHSDRIICISKATMDEAERWIKDNVPERRPNLRFGYSHIGSDFNADLYEPEETPRLSPLASKSFFLMVGTVEPRKNHALAIEALKLLRAKGHEVALCIAGREGWAVGEVMRALRANDQEGVLFIDGPSDRELAWLYSKALALFYPSRGEGFGLPPIEAASYGLPVICSDIAVLHEVCGDYASYVRVDGAAGMFEDMERWLESYHDGLTPDSSKMPKLTWKESTERLLGAILGS